MTDQEELVDEITEQPSGPADTGNNERTPSPSGAAYSDTGDDELTPSCAVDAANQLNKERIPPPQEISSGGFSGGFFCCVGGRGNGDQHPMKRNGDKPSIDNSLQIMSGDNPTSDALTTRKDDDTNVVPNDQVAHKNEQELNDVTNEPKRRNSADIEPIKLILYDQNSLPCAPVAVREHIGGNIPASVLTQSNEPSILPSSQVDSVLHVSPRNVISAHSIENSGYSLGKPHRSDHPNDDTYFHHVGANFKVFAVFDGHDGSNASIFACKYMKDFFVTRFDQKILNGVDVSKVLESFFEETERMFFESMREPLDRKISIALQLKVVINCMCIQPHVAVSVFGIKQ